MKLTCEDMQGILVQITKGNLENGKLKFRDLQSKVQTTIAKLKKEYGKAFETEGGESAIMEKPSLVSYNKKYCIFMINAVFEQIKD
jgi:hypothetical protein